jgi:hypothetical protein
MLDSDHGGGDAGGTGGETPVVTPADAACASHNHVEITDPATGLKTIFERSFEQGADGEARPVIKKKVVQTSEESDRSV